MPTSRPSNAGHTQSMPHFASDQVAFTRQLIRLLDSRQSGFAAFLEQKAVQEGLDSAGELIAYLAGRIWRAVSSVSPAPEKIVNASLVELYPLAAEFLNPDGRSQPFEMFTGKEVNGRVFCLSVDSRVLTPMTQSDMEHVLDERHSESYRRGYLFGLTAIFENAPTKYVQHLDDPDEDDWDVDCDMLPDFQEKRVTLYAETLLQVNQGLQTAAASGPGQAGEQIRLVTFPGFEPGHDVFMEAQPGAAPMISFRYRDSSYKRQYPLDGPDNLAGLSRYWQEVTTAYLGGFRVYSALWELIPELMALAGQTG